jgi:hypothetical protein
MRKRNVFMPVLTIAVFIGPAAGITALAAENDPGPLIRALWLVQRHGTAEAVDPANDERVKGTLFKALGKDGTLTQSGVTGLMDPKTFAQLAGPDGKLDREEVHRLTEADIPASRRRLHPAVTAHLDLLTTGLDQIDERHRAGASALADWIVAHHRPGELPHATAICTGNSRRSFFTALMGNAAAAYFGLPEVRFHCGGTEPTTCNPRTLRALRAIGIESEPTGDEAPRGQTEPNTANPIYRLRWGTPESGSTASPYEVLEFSKRYDDPVNPQHGFAALMVCSDADAACPVVKGASVRIAMPFLDPKIYDGSAFEQAKYTERRDDIGRVLLAAILQARRRLTIP